MPIAASYTEFLADENAVRDFGEWWVECYPLNSSGVEVPLRFSRRGKSAPPAGITLLLGSGGDLGTDIIAADQPFDMRLLSLPEITQSIWQARGAASGSKIGGRSIPTYGKIVIQNADGGLDQYHPRQGYTWASVRIKVWFMDSRDTAATIGKVFDGVVGAVQFGLNTLEITLNGHEADFEAPVGNWVFRGTGPWMLETSNGGGAVEAFVSWGAVNVGPACTTALTFDKWVWLDAFNTGNTLYDGWVPNTGGWPWRVSITYNSGVGKVVVQGTVSGTTYTYTQTLTTLALNQWYHIGVIINGKDVTIVCWDQDQQLEYVETGVNVFPSATRDTPTDAVFRTGRVGSSGATTCRAWHDEERVWNVARSVDDLRASRFAPLATPYDSSLKFYAKYNDGAGTSLADSSASALTGTINLGAGASYTWLRNVEGDATFAGHQQPEVWGNVRRVPTVLIDPVIQVYMVGHGGENVNSGNSPIYSMATEAGGTPHTMVAASSMRDLLVTVPAAGTSRYYKPRGLFRLGSIATRKVTAVVSGYFNGATPGITPLELFKRLTIYRGPKYGTIDEETATFTALAADTIANGVSNSAGFYLDNPQSVMCSAMMDYLAQAWGGYWGMKRGTALLGVGLFIGAPDASPADFALDNTSIIDITEVDTQQTVVYGVVVRHSKSYAVFGDGDIDQSLMNAANEARVRDLRAEWLQEQKISDTVRAQYPGKQSVLLVVDTPLTSAYAAKLLVDRLFTLMVGTHYGYKISLRAPGREITMNNLVSVAYKNMRKQTRYDWDGTKNFVVLTVSDKKQQGRVDIEVWK